MTTTAKTWVGRPRVLSPHESIDENEGQPPAVISGPAIHQEEAACRLLSKLPSTF